MEEMRQQLQELIDASPRNDDIIREGEYCRKAGFSSQFDEKTLERIIKIYKDHEPAMRPALLAMESEMSLGTYLRTKNVPFLHMFVITSSLAVYHASLTEHPKRGLILSTFARALALDWKRTRSDDKLLDDSIDYCRKAVELDPPQGFNRTVHLNDLGEQLAARYLQRHNATDYTEAETCFKQASTLWPSGKLVFLFQWAKLIRSKDEFEKVDKAEMLRKYILKLDEAKTSYSAEFQPTDYRVSISCFWWHFGCAFWERYEITNSPEDLETARKMFDRARTTFRHGPLDLFRACQDQGRVAALQFDKNGDLEKAKEAEDLLKQALKITPDSSLAVVSLGDHLRKYAGFIDSVEMLDEAVEVLDRAYRATVQPSDELCDAHGIALMDRFQRTGKIEDIDEASQRFAMLSKRPHELEKNHANILLKLSLCHLLRFESFEQKDDLTKALLAISQTARFKAIPASLKAECLRMTGKISQAKYITTNETKHIDYAITSYEQGLARNAGHEEENHLIRHDLGNAYYFKFKTTLSMACLSRSVSEFKLALQALDEGNKPPSKANNLMTTAGLAMSLMAQFEITRQQQDIDNAILCYEECIRETAHKTLQYYKRANNLAMAYQERFKLTMKVSDLKKSQAILLDVPSWDLSNLSPRNKCNMHNNLGRAFLLFQHKDDEPTYLEYAIDHFRSALATGCSIPAYLVAASSNLSRALRYKAKMTKRHDDQVKALTQLHDTLKFLGPMAGNSQAMHMDGIIVNLVEFILDGWRDSGYNSTSDYGKIYLQISRTMLPRLRVIGGSVAASFYIYAALAQFVIAKNPVAARDMIRTAAEILPRAMLVSFDRRDVLNNLGSFVALPNFTIAFSLAAGDPPSQVLKLFDKVRSVMWDHVLSSRLMLQGRNIENFPSLRSRLEQIQKPLDVGVEVARKAALSEQLGEMIMEQHEVYRQTVEYNRILHEVQTHPELKDYLHLPGDGSDLVDYAKEGPIIIVNRSLFRSDAIIVTANGVNSLSLPLLGERTMAEKDQLYDEALSLMSIDLSAATEKLDQVLEWLWDTVAEPILQHLGFDGTSTAEDNLPRSWWITTGQIGKFPLHAARNQKKGPHCTVLDRTVPSYINSLRALGYTRSRRRSVRQDDGSQDIKQALLVSMETTPRMGVNADLPNAVREVASIQEILNSHRKACKLLNSPARDAVLACLKQVDYAHFACHGVCDGVDPARSALRLTDWFSRPLDVRCLLQEGNMRCQLVYLSACESASNKSKFRDEGLHLAGGFQMAGVPHVIASLWRVDDGFSVDIAVRFYKALGEMRADCDPSNSARALRKAILDLEASGASSVFWAAYIHSGP